MGRSDDQRAGMKEHYKNIVQAATPNHYILGDRAQRDKPSWTVSKQVKKRIGFERGLFRTSLAQKPIKGSRTFA
jgi:hypothetical protein